MSNAPWPTILRRTVDGGAFSHYPIGYGQSEMALTNCPECLREVSDRAETCPHCGNPLKEKQPPGWYDDPSGQAPHQAYWDGEKWTGQIRPGPRTTRRTRFPPWVWVAGTIVLVIALAANQTDPDSSPSGTASCSTLTSGEIDQLTDAWTGNGSLTVEATAKAPTSGSDMFTEIWFLKGSAPGIDGEVYEFATRPGGLLIGADAVAREFFEWGADVETGSTADSEARAAARNAPKCLS